MTAHFPHHPDRHSPLRKEDVQRLRGVKTMTPASLFALNDPSFSLTEEEKTESRRRILAGIQSSPVQSLPVLEERWSLWNHFSFLQLGCASLVLILGSGIGVSAAAAHAEPGDALYPVRIHFTEEVEELLQVTKEDKTKFAIEKMERRFQELRNMMEPGHELDISARASFEDTLRRSIDDALLQVQNMDDARASSDALALQSQLEATLYAYNEILMEEALVQNALSAATADGLVEGQNDGHDADTESPQRESNLSVSHQKPAENSSKNAQQKQMNDAGQDPEKAERNRKNISNRTQGNTAEKSENDAAGIGGQPAADHAAETLEKSRDELLKTAEILLHSPEEIPQDMLPDSPLDNAGVDLPDQEDPPLNFEQQNVKNNGAE